MDVLAYFGMGAGMECGNGRVPNVCLEERTRLSCLAAKAQAVHAREYFVMISFLRTLLSF